MWHDALVKAWYQKKLTLLTAALCPFSFIFWLLISLRRFLYQNGLLTAVSLPVPVIVVGNITVGGTGKTPTVIALALFLKSAGYRVGIISRGVGARHLSQPLAVNAKTLPALSGDEAVLIAKHTGLPIIVYPDRVAAATALLKHHPCDLIISDDALQHYRLKPSITIALIDAARQYGNQHLLPAGPLREPLSRLKAMNFVLSTGKANADICFQAMDWCAVSGEALRQPLTAFANQTAHVVAGIGYPQGFFDTVASFGVQGIYHAFKDHHAYTLQDLQFKEAYPTLMTEKDAVKCAVFSLPNQWYLTQTTILPESFKQSLLHLLKGVRVHDAEKNLA